MCSWIQRLVAGDGLFRFDLGDGGRWLDFSEGDEAGLLLFTQHFLAVELSHAGVFGVLLDLCVARADLFLARVLRDAGLVEGVVGGGVDVLVVEDEIVLGFLLEADLLAAGDLCRRAGL